MQTKPAPDAGRLATAAEDDDMPENEIEDEDEAATTAEDGDAPLQHPHLVDNVRLDKWLWAARFFRTRNLARTAVESGHVRYDGERVKVSKEVRVGAVLSIRQGWDDIEVRVLALSDHRGGAPLARLLYAETAQSQERRARDAQARQASAGLLSQERPDKKQRRLIHRFKRSL